jgi:Cu+-exporting ATPase
VAASTPLASAIVAAAEARGLALASPDAFEARTGRGVVGVIGGQSVAIGNHALLSELGVEAGGLRERAQRCAARVRRRCSSPSAGAPAGVTRGRRPDQGIRRPSRATAHADGLRLVMLTGDNRATAQAVAAKLGIDEVIADVLPERRRRS